MGPYTMLCKRERGVRERDREEKGERERRDRGERGEER